MTVIGEEGKQPESCIKIHIYIYICNRKCNQFTRALQLKGTRFLVFAQVDQSEKDTEINIRDSFMIQT